ncbi:hypothetical protein HYV88_03325, partial [Candidatus Woesearchaeota archaeon]|nr:hypothetical protein [Candidatus Woesearchaeota archaeon]
SKSFLQNITTFWTNGSFLVNITWEGNTTFFGNSTAFYVDVVATSTTSSSTTSTTTSTSTTTTAEEEVVSAPSTGGGSSGGSGGGTRIGEIIQKPTETSYLVPLLSPGELKISVDDPYSNIISVLLDTNREMHNSKINIKNINIPPAEVSLFGDNALDYYEISTINLPNRAISEAVINFRYKKAESVGLFLYSDDGKWNELNSREIRSDDYYTYYEAISNKLGYFVISKKITGEKIRLESEPINTKLVKNIKIIKDKIKTIGRGDKVAVITVINIILLIFIGVIILLIYGMKKLRMK